MEPYTQTPPPRPPYKSPFIIVSFVLGILALLSTCTVFLPLCFGGLSILFAILSHRKGKEVNMYTLTGIITSSIGMLFSVLAIAFTLVFMPIMLQDEEYHQQLNANSEMLYGISFDEMLEESGIDIDKLIGKD